MKNNFKKCPQLTCIEKLVFLGLLVYINFIILLLCGNISFSKNENILFILIFFFEYIYIYHLIPFNKFIINLLNENLKYNIFKLYCQLSFKQYNIMLYCLTVILCVSITVILIFNIKGEFINKTQYFILLILLFNSYLIRFFYLLGYVMDFLMITNCFHIYINNVMPRFNIKESYDSIENNQKNLKYLLSEDNIIKAVYDGTNNNFKYYEPNLGLYNIANPNITDKIDILIILFFMIFGSKYYFLNLEWVEPLSHTVINKKDINIEILIRKWYIFFITLLNIYIFIYIYFFEKNIISSKYLKYFISKKYINILLHFYIKTLILKNYDKINSFFSIMSVMNFFIIYLALIFQTKILLFLALVCAIINSLRIVWLIPQKLYELNIRSLYEDLLNIKIPNPELFSEGICKDKNFYHIRYDVKTNEYFWTYKNNIITQKQKTIENLCSFFQLIITLIFIPYFYYIGLIFLNNFFK